ncbi:MAG: pyruvate kinase, partial [Planctomycetota bacterium]
MSSTTEPLHLRARTKIVATVGPASRSPEMLQKLIAAGVDVFRLNTAHGSLEDHEETRKNIRKLSDSSRPIAILADLAGPKIRLGTIVDGKVMCNKDAKFVFVRGNEAKEPNHLTCSYDKFIDEVTVGDDILLADGTVAMKVIEETKDTLTCEVLNRGLIRTRQGINLPGAKISMPALTERDKECAIWAAERGVDYISLSFVRSPDEIHELRK